jgi:hypothetical protein
MGCGVSRPYELLVTFMDVEYCTATRCVEPPEASKQEANTQVFILTYGNY